MTDADRPVTAAELATLTEAVDELRLSMAELRDASTTAEREEAREDVKEARADLDSAAKALGISRETLEKAAREAKSAERREELRPIVSELLAEAERTRAEELEAAETERKTKRKPKLKAASNGDEPDDDAKPESDSEPLQEHWSERGIAGLIR